VSRWFVWILGAVLLTAAPARAVERLVLGEDGPPPWLKDCAAQILARSLMEEARLRTRATRGEAWPMEDPKPTAHDRAQARKRILATLDELMLLSGLDPHPVAHRPDAVRRILREL